MSVDNITHHHEMEGLKEHLLHEAKNIVSDNMETIVTVRLQYNYHLSYVHFGHALLF